MLIKASSTREIFYVCVFCDDIHWLDKQEVSKLPGFLKKGNADIVRSLSLKGQEFHAAAFKSGLLLRSFHVLVPQTFFTADILTRHSRGGTDKMNDGRVPLREDFAFVHSGPLSRLPGTLNGTEPALMQLCAP